MPPPRLTHQVPAAVRRAFRYLVGPPKAILFRKNLGLHSSCVFQLGAHKPSPAKQRIPKNTPAFVINNLYGLYTNMSLHSAKTSLLMCKLCFDPVEDGGERSKGAPPRLTNSCNLNHSGFLIANAELEIHLTH
jgi:hypothetical protein